MYICTSRIHNIGLNYKQDERIMENLKTKIIFMFTVFDNKCKDIDGENVFNLKKSRLTCTCAHL